MKFMFKAIGVILLLYALNTNFSNNFIILHILYLYAYWVKSVKAMRNFFDEYISTTVCWEFFAWV